MEHQILAGATTEVDIEEGKVVLHLPTIRDTIAIGVLDAKLRAGVAHEDLDPVTSNLVAYISTLSIVVDEAPDAWFETTDEGAKALALEKLTDPTVLETVFWRWARWRDSFRGAGGGGGGEGGSDAMASQPVGGESDPGGGTVQ